MNPAAVTATMISSLVLALPLQAQQVADTVELADIVVTATRTPTPISQVASSVTVIEGDQLRAEGIRFVADALQRVPGASVVPTGSYGGVTSLFLRGGESDYVKVLLDGVPVNLPGGSFDWAHLTTENISRIEIVRGPASVLYGSDAMTGVVQIFTRSGSGASGVTGQVNGGSFGSVDGRVAVAGGSDAANYSVGLGYHATDGTYQFNNRYRNMTASARLEARLDDRSEATVSLRGRDYRNHFPTNGAGQVVDANQFGFGTDLALGLELGRRFDDRFDGRLALQYASTETGFDNQPDAPGDTTGFGFQQRTSSTSLKRVADLRGNYLVSSTTRLTAGIDYAHDRGRSSGTVVSNFGAIDTSLVGPTDQTRGNAGFYLQGVMEPSHGISLIAGVRLDENDQFGTFGTYRLGSVVRLGGGTRLRGTVGSGFKAPTFSENFARTPFEIGNSDLSPEKSVSWELGVEQALAGGSLVVGLSYFDQRFKDMILYQFVADTVPSYFNLGGATSRGAEVELRYFLAPELQVRGSYSYLHTEVTDAAGNSDPNTGFSEGQRLLRRPQHSFETGLSSQPWTGARLALDLRYTGKRDDLDFSGFPGQRVELDPYFLLNFAAEVELWSRSGNKVGATLRLENMLNERYQTVVGFPGRDRAAFAGLAFRF